MQNITKKQITKLHVLLNQLGLMQYKRTLIADFTDGRTTSSKELTGKEAKEIIDALSRQSPLERQKKAIWYLAHKAGIIYGNTKEDNLMNAAKLDMFLENRGTVRKPLQKMSFNELKQTHRQFEGIITNNKKTADNKYARKQTDKLLNELQIPVK